MTQNDDEKLVWLDLETTGLDSDNNMRGIFEHNILEIGLHITDSKFNVLDEGFEIIIHHDDSFIDKMPSFVKNMHTESGLIEKVKESPFSLKQAEKLVVDYLESNGVKKENAPMCGNNIKFDRNFIAAQMPDLNSFFHYRNLDVSALKEVFKRTHPDVADGVKKQMTHRGLDDIKESIAELKHYQDNIFPTPEKTPERRSKAKP